MMSAVLDVVVFNPTHNTSYIRLIQDFFVKGGIAVWGSADICITLKLGGLGVCSRRKIC